MTTEEDYDELLLPNGSEAIEASQTSSQVSQVSLDSVQPSDSVSTVGSRTLSSNIINVFSEEEVQQVVNSIEIGKKAHNKGNWFYAFKELGNGSMQCLLCKADLRRVKNTTTNLTNHMDLASHKMFREKIMQKRSEKHSSVTSTPTPKIIQRTIRDAIRLQKFTEEGFREKLVDYFVTCTKSFRVCSY